MVRVTLPYSVQDGHASIAVTIQQALLAECRPPTAIKALQYYLTLESSFTLLSARIYYDIHDAHFSQLLLGEGKTSGQRAPAAQHAVDPCAGCLSDTSRYSMKCDGTEFVRMVEASNIE